MATLTVTIDPAVLEAAQREAVRRHVTLDELIANSLTNIAQTPPSNEDNDELILLMKKRPFGTIDRPLTREEIYEERMWPRS